MVLKFWYPQRPKPRTNRNERAVVENAAAAKAKALSSSDLAELAKLGDLQAVSESASDLQWKLLHCLLAAKKNEIGTEDRLFTRMTEGSLTTSSFRAVSEELKERNIGRRTLSMASAFLEFSCYMVNMLICMITNLCRSSRGAIQPVMVFLKLRYDETPTKVRVQDVAVHLQHAAIGSSDPLQATAPSEVDSLHAKIFQMECTVGLLFKDCNSAKCTFMSVGVPTTLVPLESTTGENIEAALMNVIDTIPAVKDCPSFKLRIRRSCSDQAGSNFKAERLLTQKLPSMTTCHTLCHLSLDLRSI